MIADITGGALTVAVQESFGNCPQYIHIRDIAAFRANPKPTEPMDRLEEATRDAITAADTLFVATTGGRRRGNDISHRGEQDPGFIRVDGDMLTIPDFASNRYFNTLGNMLLDPRAALLFPDFTSGDVLLVQVPDQEIVWDVPESERLAGAERLWRLTVTKFGPGVAAARCRCAGRCEGRSITGGRAHRQLEGLSRHGKFGEIILGRDQPLAMPEIESLPAEGTIVARLRSNPSWRKSFAHQRLGFF